MGFARIISGGPTGRYTVELDYGDAMRTAALTAINQQILKIDAQLLLTQANLIDAEAREAAKRAEIQGYADALIAAANLPKPTGLGLGTLPIVRAQRELAEILAANQPIRDQIAALKFERANWRRKLTALTNLPTKVQRQAWCVDFTEDIPALAYSATCDIPGDPNLVLLAPGGRAWQASDGEFRARELLSPAQAFVNTAIYPGWQKWKPTYRWGTITAVDYDANRVSVALFDQKSDAQRLPVNQAATLSNVVVNYMDCDALAFKVNDRVLIQFQGQNWQNPRVIGFLDNPQPCIEWPDVEITVRLENRNLGAAATRSWLYALDEPYRCGPNSGAATIRCARTADVYGDWLTPNIVDPPSSGTYTVNATFPSDIMVGSFNYQAPSLLDPGESPINPSFFACSGTSPAERVEMIDDPMDAEKVIVRKYAFSFGARSWTTWDTSALFPTCTMIGSGSGLYFDGQPTGIGGMYNITPSTSDIFHGKATDYFGTPVISVTFDNGTTTRTRNYVVKSIDGAKIVYGPAPLPP